MQVEGEEPRAEPPKADAGGGGSGGEIVGAEVCEGASFAQEDCPLLVERRTAAAIAGGSRARGSCAAFGREEGHGGGRAEEETHEGSSAFECLALSKSIWSASLQVAEGEFLKGACGEKANEEPSAELPTCVWQLLPPTLRLQVDAFTKFYSLRQPKHVLSFSLHKVREVAARLESDWSVPKSQEQVLFVFRPFLLRGRRFCAVSFRAA